MALDARTAQEKLTPDERRGLLRAFADRMLLKATAMDDPEDMPGVERAVRVAAVIERVYSRCDRAEARAPDPHKVEAERARNEIEAINARADLATTLATTMATTLAMSQEQGQDRHWDPGHWRKATPRAANPAPGQAAPKPSLPEPYAPEPYVPVIAPQFAGRSGTRANDTLPPVTYVDYTAIIAAARAELELGKTAASEDAESGQDPPLRTTPAGRDPPPPLGPRARWLDTE